MNGRGRAPTIGVEEEYFLVHPASRAPEPEAARVVARAATRLGDQVTGEFSRSQIEVKTQPWGEAARLREELLRLRAGAAAAAAEEGLRICASGTPVVAGHGPVSIGDHPRYRAGVEQYRAMMDDFAVCAFHTHIDLPDRELAVLVGNHLRPWLPLLVALSANSPFHNGRDTGYAGWRAVIRSRFPCLGPPPYAESLRHHHEIASAIAESDAMLDANMPFWDIRPNPKLPTVEIRAMDVIADVDDAVALAVLLRALVTTATTRAVRGDPGPRPCSELLRAAYWRAAREGWSGSGVDALTGQLLPTCIQAQRLVAHVGPALQEHGDTNRVTAFLARLSLSGGGAERQRASLAKHGSLTGVVDDLVALTVAATY
ncbi:MAG TPA: glutamate--cysteine ligase [Mycobacterium sp.]|nr:glutamate--cysteine ligase [Mycobacterium sp.]